MKYCYFTYGLVIRSVLPFPELMEIKKGADVVIRYGKLTPFPSQVVAEGIGFRVTGEGVFLFWGDGGSFFLRDGNEIIIDPAHGVDERILRLLILGPALAILLHQRGRFPLHAATVNIGEGAVAMMGGPGCGKSSLAATLYKRGHEILCDDVTAIQTDGRNGPLVFPGFPQLKLWPEVVSFMGDDPELLPCIEPAVEKRAFRTDTNFSQKAIPLRHIYVLDEANDKQIVDLPPQEALIELIRNSYRAPLLKWIGAKQHFLQCALLANKVPISRLSRPLSLSSLPDVARMVEEDLACG